MKDKSDLPVARTLIRSQGTIARDVIFDWRHAALARAVAVTVPLPFLLPNVIARAAEQDTTVATVTSLRISAEASQLSNLVTLF